VVVAPEVVCVQEEKDAASGLVPDVASLFISDGPRQEQVGSLRNGRSDHHPTFFPVKKSVFDQFEA
jgi:hypothetical protein